MKTLLRCMVGILCLGFVACSDDEDDNPRDAEVLTGVFMDSVVSQLRYETATQAGFTNDAGEFNYVAGERITFYVGGITLGSTAGAAQITPFQLAGIAPPRNEGELRAGLAFSGTLAPIERVANIAMFLIALDVDRDPENGIDLSGADAALMNATLNFDVDFAVFPLASLRPLLLTYNVGNSSVPVTESLPHLFATLGLDMTASMISTVSNDTNNDGVIDSVTTAEYDAQGHPTRISVDTNNDGTIDTVTTRVYSGDRFTRVITESNFSAGAFHNRTDTTYAYNIAGLITNSTAERTQNDVLNRRTRITYSFDNDFNQVGFLSERDDGPDNVNDLVEVDTFTYNAAGRVTQGTYETTTAGVVTFRRSVTNAYSDALGLITQQVDDRDNTPADNTYDTHEVYTYVYDSRGNQTLATRETQTPVGTVSARDTTTSTYDAQNRQLTSVVDVLNIADGTITSRTSTTNAYVGGKIVHTETTVDAANDGDFESSDERWFSYDGNGFLATDIRQRDTNGDDALDSVVTVIYAYDANGLNQRTATSTYTATTGLTTTSVSAYAYTPVAEGTHALLYYFGVFGAL